MKSKPFSTEVQTIETVSGKPLKNGAPEESRTPNLLIRSYETRLIDQGRLDDLTIISTYENISTSLVKSKLSVHP